MKKPDCKHFCVDRYKFLEVYVADAGIPTTLTKLQ